MRRFALVLSIAFLIAAQAAPCATAAEQPFVVYEVTAGDTIRNVAARHGIDPLNLTAANGLAEADALPPAGTVLLIPKSAKDVLGTLYEAKRRGLGAWPKPRFADEFLAPLVPQNAGAGTKKPDAKATADATPKPAGGHETLRPDEVVAIAPAANDAAGEPKKENAATDVPAKQPVVKATTHLVREGDTLYRIARTYGVSFSELLRVNGFTDASMIRIGQTIRLPGEAEAAQPPAKTGPATVKPTPAAGRQQQQQKTPGIRLTWPLRSGQAPKQVGTNFGSGLSASATPGEPVYAAADGTVLHGGWMKDFGNAMYVNHGNGIATFYGGLGTLYVTSGKTVKRGTKIAVIGDGAKPRLVFHLLKDGKSIDPRAFLTEP